ncbi:chromosome segregation protein SMC [Pediococcus acidilactici]|uniref:chromosome segregation protein SMC n=1 Tax=Pediococcus acidilactici TaxID=1254 RepID=UPI00189A91D4|nr:chromosome segregation protein SMC [Pediococcus acidilactici]
MKIDELEAKRSELDRKLRKLKHDKEGINIQIDELRDQISEVEQEELNLFQGRELQTATWRFLRTESNPSKPTWWQVTKANNAKPKEIVQSLSGIDEALVKQEPNLSAIKRMVAEGRFVPSKNGQLVDTETGALIPYVAIQKPDKLSVKAVD